MSLFKPVILVIKNAHNATAKVILTAQNVPLECTMIMEFVIHFVEKPNMLTEVLSSALSATKSARIARLAPILVACHVRVGNF